MSAPDVPNLPEAELADPGGFTTPTVTPLQLAQVQLDLEFLIDRQRPKVSLPVEVDNGIHQHKVMPIDGLTLEQQRERARQFWGGPGCAAASAKSEAAR